MFGFDMVAIAAQLKAFQDQSERLVNAVEKIQLDIILIKRKLEIDPHETVVSEQDMFSLIHKVD